MDGINQAAFHKIHSLIKCALDTENLGLKIGPNMNIKGPWDMICFSNSDYVGDPVTRNLFYFICIMCISVRG